MGNLVSLRLPPATGPHPVGCTDVMVGAGREGSFFRLFYPCSPSPLHKQPGWFPRPEYLAGLIAVRGWNSKLVHYGASVITGNPPIPVIWNGDLIPSKDRKPLVIFSHGLGSFRTTYSSLCAELASHGFLVAAVEHRDGSACATYHFSVSSEDASSTLQESWVPFKKLQPEMKEFYLRNYQVHQRASECVQTVRILQDIDKGKAVNNILEPGFNLEFLKGRIDFDRVAIMGHSFGGATALLSLVKDDIFRCAVVLDAWMFPLEDTCYQHIQKPVLSINTETFQTNQSIKKMMTLNSEGAELTYLTVQGCVHSSQTDIAFLSGYLANKILGSQGTMDPKTCLKISVVSSLHFLNKHLDLPMNWPKLENLSKEIQADVISDFPVVNTSKL
ncbi:PREDICTED: platelet-activating factor acetylhydrolase 2, cytoplasmic-like [Nanorana parkeri]|uniref:platelet-activating factor acetylhydrolase 2, cytoplasmic-like n=1 Tax=Nanorana parkeri TaxID=125878 RepID=UPI0008548E61|nr:PREDICTED: platelet-activating factor acetylhydrolase 2, cytoplasmic-like [Nanorana parkeri]